MELEVGTRGVRHNPRIIRLITGLHSFLYRLTSGVVGGLISGAPQLLLTTIGRKSGKRFTTPLLSLPDGPHLVVVASYGGQAKPPHWARNLMANPQGWVQIGQHHWEVRAQLASAEERERLWPVFCHYYPGYLDYQSKTDRVIPLLILKPLWSIEQEDSTGPTS